MSWTQDQLDRLRQRMAGAKRQGAWITADEAGLIATLVQTVIRLTRGTGWSGVPEGRLPSIVYLKARGVSKFTVTCATPQCWSTRRFSFDELALDDELVFVDIPRHRHFRCRKCGSRQVTVMADWPNMLRGRSGESHSFADR